MDGGGGFPIDLILFGMIAAFLVLRLKGILGKRTGYERPPQPIQPRESPINDGTRETPSGPVPQAAQRSVPEPLTALGQSLTAMTAIDRGFSPAGFLDGAEKAFQITKEVDMSGKGIAFTTHRELAELKCEQVLGFGADPRMPRVSKGSIKATVEPAPE